MAKKKEKVIVSMEDGIITGEEYPDNIELQIRDYGAIPKEGTDVFKDEDGREYWLR